jgi:hypothetical protein
MNVLVYRLGPSDRIRVYEGKSVPSPVSELNRNPIYPTGTRGTREYPCGYPWSTAEFKARRTPWALCRSGSVGLPTKGPRAALCPAHRLLRPPCAHAALVALQYPAGP